MHLPVTLSESGVKYKVNRRRSLVDLRREKFHVDLLGIIEVPKQGLS